MPHDANYWRILLAQAGPVALDAILKSVLLLALAALVTGAMRRCSAAARHLVWLLAVTGLFALPVLSWTLPRWNILPRWMSVQPGISTAAQSQMPAIAPPEPSHSTYTSHSSYSSHPTDVPGRPPPVAARPPNPLATTSPGSYSPVIPATPQPALPAVQHGCIILGRLAGRLWFCLLAHRDGPGWFVAA